MQGPFLGTRQLVGMRITQLMEGRRREQPEDAIRAGLEHGFCSRADIEIKNQAEDARARLAAIVESSEDGIISKSLDGIITSWNEAAERIFGYTAQEMIGNSIAILIPDDQPDEEPGLLARIRNGHRISHYETTRIRKDGKRINVALTLSPIKDADGRIIGASKIVRDITERKRADKILSEAQARMVQHAELLERTVAERTAKLQETIDVLESFCHSIAHDLRAPLRALSGFSRELQETHQDTLDQDGKETLERIANAALRMDQLILDLLRLGRISTAELSTEQVDLQEILDDALSVLASEFKRVGARLKVCQPLHPVQGNKVLLDQAITNLLGNAIKFVRPNVPPEVTVRTEPKGKMIRVYVEDNGIGIKPAQIRKLFQPFLRLVSADQYPGTGVGLAIVRKAAERLGGSVGVESEPGKGSCFWIDLPSTDSAAAANQTEQVVKGSMSAADEPA
jgi:PAS domain S-box-containing protein